MENNNNENVMVQCALCDSMVEATPEDIKMGYDMICDKGFALGHGIESNRNSMWVEHDLLQGR